MCSLGSDTPLGATLETFVTRRLHGKGYVVLIPLDNLTFTSSSELETSFSSYKSCRWTSESSEAVSSELELE